MVFSARPLSAASAAIPNWCDWGVMAGAKIVFHPNTALDTIAVSREKRGGLDGIAVRAFESPVFYAFANSVGP